MSQTTDLPLSARAGGICPIGTVTGNVNGQGATLAFHSINTTRAFLPNKHNLATDDLGYTLGKGHGPDVPIYTTPAHIALWGEGFDAGIAYLAACLGMDATDVADALMDDHFGPIADREIDEAKARTHNAKKKED